MSIYTEQFVLLENYMLLSHENKRAMELYTSLKKVISSLKHLYATNNQNLSGSSQMQQAE